MPSADTGGLTVTGATGATNVIYNGQNQVTGVCVFDQARNPRIGLEARADGSFGLDFLDSAHTVIWSAPPLP